MTTSLLQRLNSELGRELIHILDYWEGNTLDLEHGGFFGRIDHHNVVVVEAPKGIILNTRILWSFSAASNHLKTRKYSESCDSAYQYIMDFFYDEIHGGVFWELDHRGNVLNKRKQVYAQAFAIYALSEYYTFSGNIDARRIAIDLFEKIEQYSRDERNDGYLEAFDEQWAPIEDVRLSNKDMDAVKTMNTHLHVLEAYTSLLKIYESVELRESLRSLIKLFFNQFLNSDYHYNLFYDRDWKLLSNTISYGHDIEASWLIIDAAKVVNDKILIAQSEVMALKVADAFLKEALDEDGGVVNEKNLKTNHIDRDKHWWPQMEAIVGLAYVYKLSGDRKYLTAAIKIWDFVRMNLIDTLNGEWHFRVDSLGNAYVEEDKVSMWKAPYHSSRACIILNGM